VEQQEWREPTGRLTLDWKPELSFTDETLLYASYAHGYKAGGSNPPPSGIVIWTPEVADFKVHESAVKPKTFDPEFVNAFEIGTKNTLLDGRLTVNADAFYYDYTGYQVSQIIDRSAVNYNFDAKVWGLELEADWRPLENLRLGFKGGYENTRIADGERAIDIMDRTAGRTDWVVARPFPTFPSNCVLPRYIYDAQNGDGLTHIPPYVWTSGWMGQCEYAYVLNVDPVTLLPYTPNPTMAAFAYGYPPDQWYPLPSDFFPWVNYPGFDPSVDYGNNHGEGFYKELGGHELPNAPHFTATITADYTVPLPSDWLMTLHTDLYYQSEAWTRVFNMEGYDKLKAYTNVNVAAIFTNEDAGWKVMAYVKNIFDHDAITGAFLNSDDTGLTTNVFLNEPRLYGLRVTKDWRGMPWSIGSRSASGPFPLTVELGGSIARIHADNEIYRAPFESAFAMPGLPYPAAAQGEDLDWGDGREIKVTYARTDGWKISAAYRRAETNGTSGHALKARSAGGYVIGDSDPKYYSQGKYNYSDTRVRNAEDHALVDFTVGKDIGLGVIAKSTSAVSLGVRIAQFHSTTSGYVNGIPNYYVHPTDAIKYDMTHDTFRSTFDASRSFKGAGPVLSWEASMPLWGADDTGTAALDLGASAGVLFGTQRTHVETTASGKHSIMSAAGKYDTVTNYPDVSSQREKTASVPSLQLNLGLSYAIDRFKLSTGYRVERYFDVLDTGLQQRQTSDRTTDGPYFKIAVGFGG
jgi:hypothetical protein